MVSALGGLGINVGKHPDEIQVQRRAACGDYSLGGVKEQGKGGIKVCGRSVCMAI